MIDITGLDKVAVFMALYAAAKPLGLGFLQYVPGPLAREEASRLLVAAGGGEVGYVKGRVMHVDLSGDHFDPYLYDRDNGQGAAARAIEALKTEVR